MFVAVTIIAPNISIGIASRKWLGMKAGGGNQNKGRELNDFINFTNNFKLIVKDNLLIIILPYLISGSYEPNQMICPTWLRHGNFPIRTVASDYKINLWSYLSCLVSTDSSTVPVGTNKTLFNP